MQYTRYRVLEPQHESVEPSVAVLVRSPWAFYYRRRFLREPLSRTSVWHTTSPGVSSSSGAYQNAGSPARKSWSPYSSNRPSPVTCQSGASNSASVSSVVCTRTSARFESHYSIVALGVISRARDRSSWVTTACANASSGARSSLSAYSGADGDSIARFLYGDSAVRSFRDDDLVGVSLTEATSVG